MVNPNRSASVVNLDWAAERKKMRPNKETTTSKDFYWTHQNTNTKRVFVCYNVANNLQVYCLREVWIGFMQYDIIKWNRFTEHLSLSLSKLFLLFDSSVVKIIIVIFSSLKAKSLKK
jgi:hypothetical protein